MWYRTSHLRLSLESSLHKRRSVYRTIPLIVPISWSLYLRSSAAYRTLPRSPLRRPNHRPWSNNHHTELLIIFPKLLAKEILQLNFKWILFSSRWILISVFLFWLPFLNQFGNWEWIENSNIHWLGFCLHWMCHNFSTVVSVLHRSNCWCPPNIHHANCYWFHKYFWSEEVQKVSYGNFKYNQDFRQVFEF